MIRRAPNEAASMSYDLIIVGAGIYGVSLALMAAGQGLRPLLLDRADFGAATSWNSLRIVHGGFRYLQTGDLYRFAESVAERRWFLNHFPELVSPLPCLLPLYGNGLKRPTILRAALALNDLLSRNRNKGSDQGHLLPNGRILDSDETKTIFPHVNPRGLQAGAVWYDAIMSSASRVLIEMIKWACSLGAKALNYAEVIGRKATGDIVVRERISGDVLTFRAPIVVNCAGPWCRELAANWDRDRPELFRPCLGFNLVLKKPLLSSMALAVSPPRQGSRIYFLHSSDELLFAGTYYTAWQGPIDAPAVPPAAVSDLLGDLNEAIPSIGFRIDEVAQILPGFLPVKRDKSLLFSDREVILDHGSQGGPEGLISISGVKFTTARKVAEKTIRMVIAKLRRPWRERFPDRVPSPSPPDADQISRLMATDLDKARKLISEIANQEAVIYPEDLMLRRTEWGIRPAQSTAIRDLVTHELGHVDGPA